MSLASCRFGRAQTGTGPTHPVQLHDEVVAAMLTMMCIPPGLRTWSAIITLALATRCAHVATQEGTNLFCATRIAIGAVRPKFATAAVGICAQRSIPAHIMCKGPWAFFWSKNGARLHGPGPESSHTSSPLNRHVSSQRQCGGRQVSPSAPTVDQKTVATAMPRMAPGLDFAAHDVRTMNGRAGFPSRKQNAKPPAVSVLFARLHI